MHPEVWGGVECSVVRVGDTYRDELHKSAHDRRAGDPARIAALGVRAIRFPILWERTAPESIAAADWAWADERLRDFRALGVRPIAGLVHHGSGPRSTSLVDASFATGLADYAAAVAERYPWIEDFTPVNEPLTTARFSALYGHWYPHARSFGAFLRALVNQCRATVLAMSAIRTVRPSARLVQTEDFARVSATPRLAYQAEHENARRWLSLDLLCGRVDRAHPLYRMVVDSGVDEDELAFFRDHPCPPDVIGLNYYLTSERFLDDALDRYPRETHGGNGREPYADVETVRVEGHEVIGHAGALRETWDRYRLPLAITEVHLGCTREEQLRWWAEAWAAANGACRDGIDVRGVTAWALLGSHDWDSLLVDERGHYEPGAFDLRGDAPRPTALAIAVASSAAGSALDHPVLDSPGWWRRPSRIVYGRRREDESFASGSSGTSGAPARRILITGADGTLAQALARVCQRRGLAYAALRRDELDVTSAASIDEALAAYRPWAIVNGAGYARVEEAEGERDHCWRANVHGAHALALACGARGLPLVIFSSDLVFDGRRAVPYLESDATAPLNVLGESKAESERLVLSACDAALVVRTGELFGPWDEVSFVPRALRTLAARTPLRVADDFVLSPTYAPDLADAALDLLVDGERGVWHLANEGAVSPAEWARLAARAHGVACDSLVPCSSAALGLRATRPAYSVLASARGALLRTIDAALEACARDRDARAA